MKLKEIADFVQNTYNTKQKKQEPKKRVEPRLKQAEIENMQVKKRQQQNDLRELEKKNGMASRIKPSIPNRISDYGTVAEEAASRRNATLEQTQIIRAQLPALLKALNKIPDPRNPKTMKHKKTTLLIYGILCFVFQMSSRREANREMTTPQFFENIKALFPEIETLPHNDTLKRLLERIDILKLEEAHIAIIRNLIRNKKFKKYLINNCYPVAIDGTQKFISHDLWDERLQQRTVKKGDDTVIQYYVSVLEANLVLTNGMSIPLLSEFLDYQQGDTASQKQDCETRAFKRLAARLKSHFPNLRIMVLLDGLYANGPIIEQCDTRNWQYMIVLKDGSLPTVWEEANALIKLLPNNYYQQQHGDRQQNFWWVNQIGYTWGTNGVNELILHLVVCNETWKEIDETGDLVIKTSKHAWLSSRPLNQTNLHTRCNLGARYRWGIESSLLKEKEQGYQYEHCFSKNWEALMGYHYLMRIAHCLNELVHFSAKLAKKVREKTVRGWIRYIFETCKARWFRPGEIESRLLARHCFQLL